MCLYLPTASTTPDKKRDLIFVVNSNFWVQRIKTFLDNDNQFLMMIIIKKIFFVVILFFVVNHFD